MCYAPSTLISQMGAVTSRKLKLCHRRSRTSDTRCAFSRAFAKVNDPVTKTFVDGGVGCPKPTKQI